MSFLQNFYFSILISPVLILQHFWYWCIQCSIIRSIEKHFSNKPTLDRKQKLNISIFTFYSKDYYFYTGYLTNCPQGSKINPLNFAIVLCRKILLFWETSIGCLARASFNKINKITQLAIKNHPFEPYINQRVAVSYLQKLLYCQFNVPGFRMVSTSFSLDQNFSIVSLTDFFEC